jgi:hypothetical protein
MNELGLRCSARLDEDDEDSSDSDGDAADSTVDDAAGGGTASTRCAWQPGSGATQQVARRADLLISLSQHFGYADVSVAHPATASLLGGAVDPPASHTALVAAKLRERAKQRTYEDCPAYDGYEVTPFVLGTHGGFGPLAVSLLRRLAATTDAHSRAFQRGLDMVAVALVKGNRVIEHVAIPKLRQAMHDLPIRVITTY